MSSVSYTLSRMRTLDAAEFGSHIRAAFIGSRSLKNDEDTIILIRDLAKTLCGDQKCTVVSGGAYGPDQSGMEGALDIPPHSLDPIIPISSRNAHKILPLITRLTGAAPLVDTVECFFSTDRLVVFYPDFRDGYHPGKYIERDRKIVRGVDVVIAWWDGSSRGTKKTVEYALSQGKKVYVFQAD